MGPHVKSSLRRRRGEVAARSADGGADAVRRRATSRPLHHALRARSPSLWLRHREDWVGPSWLASGDERHLGTI